MTRYEELLDLAYKEGLITKEKPLQGNDGRIKGSRIAIREELDTTEKTCVLAEELGHYYTSSGDILDQQNVSNRKQERRIHPVFLQQVFQHRAVRAVTAGMADRGAGPGQGDGLVQAFSRRKHLTKRPGNDLS